MWKFKYSNLSTVETSSRLRNSIHVSGSVQSHTPSRIRLRLTSFLLSFRLKLWLLQFRHIFPTLDMNARATIVISKVQRPPPTHTSHLSLSALSPSSHTVSRLYPKTIFLNHNSAHQSHGKFSRTGGCHAPQSYSVALLAPIQGARIHYDAYAAPKAHAAYFPASVLLLARSDCTAITSW